MDTEKAANHLCSDCLNRVMENCLDTAPMGIGVIDFYTNEVRLLIKSSLAFPLATITFPVMDGMTILNGKKLTCWFFIVQNAFKTEGSSYHPVKKDRRNDYGKINLGFSSCAKRFSNPSILHRCLNCPRAPEPNCSFAR